MLQARHPIQWREEMNKRQRKKQFKKIFGMNPKQYDTWMEECWPGFIKERADHIAAALNGIAEAAKEAAKIIMEGIETLAEEMKTAAGFMETDEMIRKAHIMPEGTEKELLQHIGIRMDRYGWAYDFYYDEANKAYFMEILQEGGKRDGK